MATKLIKDLNKLNDIFSQNGNILALSLLDKAKFMETTLQQLQEKVTEGGVVTKMCQGKYDIDRANPALQAYNVTIKNYTSVIKQLNDMLPKTDNRVDDFDSFGE